MGFASILLEWFRENGRDLPWRQTRDPYAIWLSEIILQQTQENKVGNTGSVLCTIGLL